MVFSALLYKMLHDIGFAMLFGGALTSLLLLSRSERPSECKDSTFVATHLVAAPGLVLLLITGLAQSFLHNWAEFKGAGYMHAKVTLVLLVVAFLAIDIRGQGVLRRLEASGQSQEGLVRTWVMRRKLALGLLLACLFCIAALIVFRPF